MRWLVVVAAVVAVFASWRALQHSKASLAQMYLLGRRDEAQAVIAAAAGFLPMDLMEYTRIVDAQVTDRIGEHAAAVIVESIAEAWIEQGDRPEDLQ